MMANESRYLTLKLEVLVAAGNVISLARIKEHFAAAIKSKRALSRASSLESIIYLLEERDLLNSRNVTCLQQLGELLKNDEIKKLVHVFKKIYLIDVEEQCVCGIEASYQLDSNLMSEHQENQGFSQNNNHVIINADLTQAAQNISQRIGRLWVYLARELDIKEGLIDRFRAQYPKNHERQALEALLVWLNREKENASIERLSRALNSRHCQRMGIGSFLLEPIR